MERIVRVPWITSSTLSDGIKNTFFKHIFQTIKSGQYLSIFLKLFHKFPCNNDQQRNTYRRRFPYASTNMPANTISVADPRVQSTGSRVQSLINFFEDLPCPSSQEPRFPDFYIEAQHLKDLRMRGLTYRDALETCEKLNPNERSAFLRSLLASHEQMMRSLAEYRKKADDEEESEILLDRLDSQLDYLHWRRRAYHTVSMRDQKAAAKEMKDAIDFNRRILLVVRTIEDMLLDIFTKLDSLYPHRVQDIEPPYSDIEDSHAECDIDVYGRVLTESELNDMQAALKREAEQPNLAMLDVHCDHRMRCAFCYEAYEAHHSAFQLDACTHIVGRECMETWLGCPHRHGPTCPHCRQILFEVPETPSTPDTQQTNERRDQIDSLATHLHQMSIKFARLTRIVTSAYGSQLAERMGLKLKLSLSTRMRGKGIFLLDFEVYQEHNGGITLGYARRIFTDSDDTDSYTIDYSP